ncbi:hypothetical protein COCC4DRAFT_34930 [Bipolaris maydis ATCC 48331]|uniref:Uncharacterized protein n=2 Tax=Cochliobolus heterostrophus TaxID=5016 RepID=M2TF32_COCH5|nr:uncharacterized protein COCC4DRAFT_34930 [Bipolaris maydis ATCC 48331]EMD85124.1 hypothetical protein COCHEDRAFT_1024680 [Bipolaris maydis C5]ENH99212.1 hypothetical protein COCC4DRAFT_34930 [Bipolaris maydis ATCC 48331]
MPLSDLGAETYPMLLACTVTMPTELATRVVHVPTELADRLQQMPIHAMMQLRQLLCTYEIGALTLERTHGPDKSSLETSSFGPYGASTEPLPSLSQSRQAQPQRQPARLSTI